MRKLLQTQASWVSGGCRDQRQCCWAGDGGGNGPGPGIPGTEVERSSTGVPGVMFAVGCKDSHEDLNLTTTDGMTELTKRIADAAKQGCREIGLPYRTAQPGDWLCARHATREAIAEVEQLVAAR